MTEPHIVTPQEAQAEYAALAQRYAPGDLGRRLAHTVATEHERIAAAERAAVVKALLPIRRNAEAHAITAKALGTDQRPWLDLLILVEHAENGALL